ncbi:hypothetical protein BGP89_04460 [Luteimonas sp. JM171]|uniref:hypothetical protein n=1 Tax=Luteimonas sp. JM171 TaxID=1896164 RepID=UPI000858FD05|nr:hypothetical protein [Luteimonas sp. JM171]AOH35702.1 hypothetical protein BGP89_04460 [Luteimonas sp. JM171]
MSDCTAKMSRISRLQVCDHRLVPSPGRMSSSMIRTRSPSRRMVPSSRWATPSFAAITACGSLLPLNSNAELRPITRRSEIRVRPEISSSDRPSEKYSSAGSPPALTSGSTAIERASVPASGSASPDTSRSVSSSTTATESTAMIM